MKRAANYMLESSMEEFAQYLAKGTRDTISKGTAAKGLGDEVTAKYITHFIEYMLLDAIHKYKNLNKSKLLSDKEVEAYTKSHVATVKTNIQDSVALAFEKVFSAPKLPTEYYCIVRQVPEPISKVVS